MNENNYDMMGEIISKPLTSTFHGSLHFAENSLSAKAAVKYKTGRSQPHTLNFSAKLQDNSRGTLIREGVYVTLQVCRAHKFCCSISHVTFLKSCVCVCVCVCKRERERERDKQAGWLIGRKTECLSDGDVVLDHTLITNFCSFILQLISKTHCHNVTVIYFLLKRYWFHWQCQHAHRVSYSFKETM
jgi:hypothetical protein